MGNVKQNEKENRMSPLEREQHASRALAMTREEQRLYCMCFPFDILIGEVNRREKEQAKAIRDARKALKAMVQTDCIPYTPKVIYSDEVQKAPEHIEV